MDSEVSPFRAESNESPQAQDQSSGCELSGTEANFFANDQAAAESDGSSSELMELARQNFSSGYHAQTMDQSCAKAVKGG
jgi:hypothetical protein